MRSIAISILALLLMRPACGQGTPPPSGLEGKIIHRLPEEFDYRGGGNVYGSDRIGYRLASRDRVLYVWLEHFEYREQDQAYSRLADEARYQIRGFTPEEVEFRVGCILDGAFEPRLIAVVHYAEDVLGVAERGEVLKVWSPNLERQKLEEVDPARVICYQEDPE